jgi:hypothetical protein
MNKALPPVRCLLCDACNGIVPARFHLVFPQKDSEPVLLDWWECRTCRSWFVHPVPTPDVISRFWETADWADPAEENAVARAKEALLRRILAELPRWTKPGPLLDFGCNFGQFIIMAREAGWTPSGFEPNTIAAEIARSKGFDVRSGWSLSEAGFCSYLSSTASVLRRSAEACKVLDLIVSGSCLTRPQRLGLL